MPRLAEAHRPLDPAEVFFYLLDRLSGMNFVVFAERCGTLDARRVRAALDAVQAQDPLLRACIVRTPDAGLRFAPRAQAPIPLQVIDTTAGGWTGFIEGELARPFAQGEAPLLRCLLLQWPGRCVLALTFHHCIGDGRSGAELMRRVFDAMAGTGAGGREPMLPLPPLPPLPPMHAVFPAGFRWDERPEAAEQVYGALMDSYRRHGKPARLPWLDAQSARRVPRVLRVELAPAELRGLVAAGRAHGATVHGALCAAQLLATHRLQPAAAPLFLSCPVDMRPHLAPVQPVAPTALCVTMLASPFAIDAATDFWALAREVTAHTRMQLARGDGHLFFCLYGLDRAAADDEALARFDRMVMGTPQGPCVSNVGRVPPVESDPAVEAISFALCPMPYQSAFSAVTTYAERPIVNFTFDAGKQPEDTARTCAEGMRELLREAAARA